MTDFIIQSYSAATQYKNRHAFALLQKLAVVFNLRIIHIYGAAGHGKGTIDAMSSFGIKNILRRDFVNYLNIKNPQFYYAHVNSDMLIEKRHLYTGDYTPIEIKRCMKQCLIVFKPNWTKIVCREYLCDCSHCIDLDFDNCSSSELSDDSDNNAEEEFEEKEYESYGYHIFDFVEIPSCVTLISGCSIEPLRLLLWCHQYWWYVLQRQLSQTSYIS